MDNLYLCFFGDGKLWENVSLVAAYPLGFSYGRPFRYRDCWVQQEVLHDMAGGAGLDKLVGVEATLAMRFRSQEHQSLILPVRRVEITHIDFMPRSHSVYFTMGQMVNFARFDGLRSVCVEIPSDEADELVGEGPLFFRSSVKVPDDHFASEDEEPAAWTAYSDLIARDDTVSINEEARHSIFFRFREPIVSGPTKKTAVTECLYDSAEMGRICGACLKEGASYELVISHRVPRLIGQDNTMGQLSVGYEVPSENIELNRTEEEYTANYQNHVLLLSANRPSGTYQELTVKPEASEMVLEDDGKVRAVSLRIPVKVSMSLMYRLRTFWVWVLAVFVALALSSVLGAIDSDRFKWGLLLGQVALNLGAALLITLVRARL